MNFPSHFSLGWLPDMPDAHDALFRSIFRVPQMKACLAQGMPFVFGFSVYEHVMTQSVARTGLIRMPKPGERLEGGHAVMAVGYDDASETLLFRNSWGESWGKKGYGQLPYGYLTDRNLSDDFWCIQATADDRYALFRTSPTH